MQRLPSTLDFVLFPHPTENSVDSSNMMALESARYHHFPFLPQFPLDVAGMDPVLYQSLEHFPGMASSVDGSTALTPAYYTSSPLYLEDMHKPMSFPPAPSTPSSMANSNSSLTPEHMSGFGTSVPSVPSRSPSAVGSPYSAAAQGFQEPCVVASQYGPGLSPSLEPSDLLLTPEQLGNSLDLDGLQLPEKFPNCVDPSLLQSIQSRLALPPVSFTDESQSSLIQSTFASPILPASPLSPSQLILRHPPSTSMPTSSPYSVSFLPQPTHSMDRRPSISSIQSGGSQPSPRVSHGDGGEDEAREKGCLECGRVFRDLKAHMLTHQAERPEKCPIVNCEYHLKGFARKYDKNRHTLTHYKGTMVCGFCPGSGSAAEKSFNRADVFKRHLTSVHGVEQNPPNCRKRSPTTSNRKLSAYSDDATGKCSTCACTFNNAQEFYEHLDDCVLRVVQQEEPSEAINQKRLAEVAGDEDVHKTMEKHMLLDTAGPVSGVDNFDEDNDNDHASHIHNPSPPSSLPDSRPGKGTSKGRKAVVSGSASRTVLGSSAITKCSSAAATKARVTASRRRNNRNSYPPPWGCPQSKMKMKKRVLTVFDGRRRLGKDEMMLDNQFEVRIRLPGGAGDGTHQDRYVTDLDVETLRRADGVFNATEEERGPWIGGSDHRLIGQPAMLLPEVPASQVEEIEIS